MESNCENLVEGEELSFEEAMHQIESLVRSMESSSLPLNDMLLAFEKGVKLTRFCQEYLDNAEQRIDQIITSASGNVELRPFHPESEAK